MRRFFHPKYVLFSLKLAFKAFRLKNTSGENTPLNRMGPVRFSQKTELKFSHLDSYHAFSYFDYHRCIEYYKAYTGHATVDIIKAMVYYNEPDRNDSTFVLMVDTWIVQYASICDQYCKCNLSFSSDRYVFKDVFLSGIVQGKAISLLIRAYAVTQDNKYRILAQKAIEACMISIEDNGAFRSVNELPWVEEYPDLSRPSMVLNGHLFLLVGLIDYLTFTNDKRYGNFTHELISSTLTYLPHFRHGDDLLYELGRWKFCNVHYLGIMTPLFEHLYKQTGIDEFQKYGLLTKGRCNWKLFNWLIENEES